MPPSLLNIPELGTKDSARSVISQTNPIPLLHLPSPALGVIGLFPAADVGPDIQVLRIEVPTQYRTLWYCHQNANSNFIWGFCALPAYSHANAHTFTPHTYSRLYFPNFYTTVYIELLQEGSASLELRSISLDNLLVA